RDRPAASPVLGLEVEVERAVEDAFEPGVRERLRLEHGRLHRTPSELVEGARGGHLGPDHRTATHLGDDDPAALAQRYVVGPGPVLQDRFLDGGGVARGEIGVDAVVARRPRGRSRGWLRRLLGAVLCDALQAPLRLPGFAAGLLLLLAELGQLLLGEPALLLGLFLLAL